MPLNVLNQSIIGAVEGADYRKFGANPNASKLGGAKYIWPLDGDIGTYPWPVAAQTTTIESDAADDGKAFLVQGLDGEGFEQEDTITLSGVTTLPSQYFRVYRAITLNGDPNVGNISIKHGADTLAYIPAGLGQTQQVIHTVPVNKTFYISEILLCLGAGRGADFQLWSRDPNTSFTLQGNFYIENTSVQLSLDPYTPLTPLTDWFIAADMTETGAVSAQVLGYMGSANGGLNG